MSSPFALPASAVTPTTRHTPSTKDPAGALLTRVADGDQWAFVELYDSLAPRALGIATRVIVDRQFAEDVVQEVFSEIWQKATSFDRSKGSGATWVFGLTRNRAIDRVRAEQAARRRDLDIGRRDWVAESDDVATMAEAAEVKRLVDRALRVLPEAQRETVVLSYHGYSHASIAEQLDIPIGTVKSRLRAAIARLREEFGVNAP
jgi:RNA polymerase sigma-70 factor, ECF subfamily